jgi:4-diphosphocytidyl-2-C-methyl-D-erythritol kinase
VQDVRLNSQNANFNVNTFQNPRLSVGGFVEVDAYAKINLFLSVVGKAENNYHEILSVIQAISLHDSLMIKKVESGKPVELKVNIPTLPADDTNLVVKAAKLIIQNYDITQAVQISLVKQIPIGAGLGGGSSDCAAVLLAMNLLFDLNISTDTLMEMGKTLGADVPFCIYANANGGTAIVKGIGEKITPIVPHPRCYIVLAWPQVHVSTKEIFKKYSQLNKICKKGLHTPTLFTNFLQAYESENVSLTAKNLMNTFTPVTSGLHPQILTLIADLQNNKALGASMTGTGSAVFAYFEDEYSARTACGIMQAIHKDTVFFVTHTIP